MCLAQGHNASMLVRLKPGTPLSRDKHSTTVPLRSLVNFVMKAENMYMFDGFSSYRPVKESLTLCMLGNFSCFYC